MPCRGRCLDVPKENAYCRTNGIHTPPVGARIVSSAVRWDAFIFGTSKPVPYGFVRFSFVRHFFTNLALVIFQGLGGP